VTVATAVVPDPRGLGRIVRDAGNRFLRIVEERDADEAERALCEINAGFYVMAVEAARRLLPAVGTRNAQKEFYLTDLPALALPRAGASTLEDAAEALGINDAAELLRARRCLGERILVEHTARGVIIEDPDHTVIETGVRIGAGTVIAPFCVIRRGVSIAARCRVGPYAHLRGGTKIAEGAAVGNFVEVKASSIGRDSRVLHLAYLGDAQLGRDVNVGAGTVTANFDGHEKHRTVVGDGASLGSGTQLVAPVRVGRGARTGAGAVVPARQDVPPGSTVAGVPARPLDKAPRDPGRERSPRGSGRARR
jgi:bifunctional UDP-N-acetylglucosamine pyrophosphorylase/glucosamine-1-phosphate N-acetyltransferase